MCKTSLGRLLVSMFVKHTAVIVKNITHTVRNTALHCQKHNTNCQKYSANIVQKTTQTVRNTALIVSN